MSTEQKHTDGDELIWEGIRFRWGVPVKPGYYLWKPNGQYSTPFPVSCADLKSWHGTAGWWCELVPMSELAGMAGRLAHILAGPDQGIRSNSDIHRMTIELVEQFEAFGYNISDGDRIEKLRREVRGIQEVKP